MSQFSVGPLRDMVAAGATTGRSVRLFWRTDRAGPFWLHLLSGRAGDQDRGPIRPIRIDLVPDEHRDFTFALTYPDQVPGGPGAPGLVPLTAYTYRVLAGDGSLVGEGRFETAPAGPEDTPPRLSLAALSCHQPFDPGGRVRPDAVRMLAALPRALDEHDVKRVLFLGDQIYADGPTSLSLFTRAYFRKVAPPGRSCLLSCTDDEIRRLYHERYRTFWAVPGFQRIQAGYATSCVLDDHEVIDNWGSPAEHESERWQRLSRAALDACFDYQGRRTFAGGRPASLHHDFHYGSVSVFVMDIRSQRRCARGTFYGEDQFEDLRRFLLGASAAAVVVLVISVPPLYVPSWLTALGVRLPAVSSDFMDRWSSPQVRPARDRLLGLLAEHRGGHQRQQMVILSGDIHAGCAALLRLRACPELPVYQFVSSAVTNGDRDLMAVVGKRFAHLLPFSGDEVVAVEPLPGAGRNPFFGLNAGILEVLKDGRDGERAGLRWKLVSHDGKDPASPVTVYDSGVLA